MAKGPKQPKEPPAPPANAEEAKSQQIEQLNAERILHPDQAPSATGKLAEPQRAGGKVLVGFKVGIAYLDIQLSRLVEQDEQTQTGVRRIKIAERYGDTVRIRGTAYPRGQVPEGFPDRPEMIHGATVNRNIDRNFMAEWLKINEKNPIVTNRMIFIAEDEIEFRAIAAELIGEKSGLDPLDPRGKDPRMPKPTNKDVSDLAPGVRGS